ncbi:response regulator transcription factor [Oceanobacillus longus]|uniref:Response regulator transcription factor n=1 Tax=Oceanobacillus longus TaxID=930120 RepID=A0ABV8GRT4_9BACI
MVQMSTLSDQLQLIENTASHEKQLVAYLEMYTDLFPVQNAYLLRYSPLGFLGEGIISLEQDEIKYIHELRYDIRTLPTIMAAIDEKKAKFYRDRELFEKTSSNFVIESAITSFLVTPICCRSIVVGFIYSSLFNEGAEFNEEDLNAITDFSNKIGQIIQGSTHKDRKQLLSKREFEVMKRIAKGELTKEIASSLSISELTVKQYVKMAIKKLDATNRVHAIAEMFRRGMLA